VHGSGFRSGLGVKPDSGFLLYNNEVKLDMQPISILADGSMHSTECLCTQLSANEFVINFFCPRVLRFWFLSVVPG